MEQNQLKGNGAYMSDTIAAVATGSSMSAIGIVRISGDSALTVADNVFRAKCGTKLNNAENRRMYYGELYSKRSKGISHDTDTSDGTAQKNSELIDLCLCMVSRKPDSYTGEDSVEFHCHGSPIVLTEVLNSLFSLGVRPALPGEFTKRAFLNGRLDLSQAEAVIDLIEAETPAAAKNAAGQLHGAVGLKMDSIYNRLGDIVAHFHAVIDYTDEDIDEFKMQNYSETLHDIENELHRMLETHGRGTVLREGLPTVIIGRPNTGKSSLLNALLGYDRAIVTEIAGTTRDTVEEKLLVGNVLLRLIDTAGLRKSDDSIEKLGVERTHAAISAAKLVILVLDGSEPMHSEDFEALNSIPSGVPLIAVINKSDLPEVLKPYDLEGREIVSCRLSAKFGTGLDTLVSKICEIFPEFDVMPSGELITNTRQAEAILRAAISLKSASSSLTSSVTADAVLTDIEAALTAIGEVTGKTLREDIVSRIFERFCVGK